ncbi:hypothetical protein CCR97_04170 [Rhodoplanes elegans]|uniref:Uncharacterized protein n=1 Tax=Rhodoplanes elegans TaxID=29408 RepID=A0A327KVZ7_9BRAD|nr:hypothetical protein [Rhodoplanes elegans]MBK5957405.1 hypothetical protein [Rhodoplanes elegans]RAI39528.1 hypothetical protein CH338_09145 [Rhodoplanes elegans]
MSGMDTIIREEARLILLRTLAEEPDGTLNSELLRRRLEHFGVSRTREWVHGELRHLEQLGAVRIVSAESVLVATLTSRGEDHVARRAVLDGVKRPSAPSV